MATLPTTDDTIRAILDAAKTYNTRPGEIIPMMGVMMKVPPLFRAEDVTQAFSEMEARGWIEFSRDKFFKLTDSGFAQL